MDDGRRSWPSMETDCLVEIFTRLGLEDLTLMIPFVCKPWFVAARHPLCWRKLDFRRLDLLPWSNFAKSFRIHHSLPSFSFTHFLSIAVNQSCKSVTEIRFPLKLTSLEDLVIVSNECKYLKHLALPILSEGEEVQIPQLVCKWRDLEGLELETKPSNFAELVKKISLNCSKFSSFKLSGSSIREEDALAIVKYLPDLKKLELINSYLLKEALTIILHGCKDLESLSVIDCIGFEDDEEDFGSRYSHIKDFKMEGCKLFYEYDCGTEDSSNTFYLHGYIY